MAKPRIELPPLRFERRRYYRTTYTWVEAEINGQWVSLGDPWPCVTPKRSEIAEAVAWKRRLLTEPRENFRVS